MKIMVACPTAEIKDYALEAWLDAYRHFESEETTELFMVDTTPDTTSYQEKLLAAGVDCLHMQPPYWPQLICLVYTVNKAWEIIIEEAWRREVDYVLSLESDVIAPPETIDVMVGTALDTDAQIVAHSYPYIARPKGVHSLGCMLIDRFLFEPGESLHNPRNKNLYELGNGRNFEDMVWDKPILHGGRVVRLDNFLTLQHWQVEVPEHMPTDG